MAVSWFRVESEAPGDIVSAVLWRDPHIQKHEREGERVCDRARINERERLRER